MSFDSPAKRSFDMKYKSLFAMSRVLSDGKLLKVRSLMQGTVPGECIWLIHRCSSLFNPEKTPKLMVDIWLLLRDSSRRFGSPLNVASLI